MAALQQHRGRSPGSRDLDLGQHLVDRERPRLLVARLAVEGAELAIGDADVRVVRIGVDDERHDALRQAREADVAGKGADLQQRRLRQEIPPVLALEPLAVERLLADLVEQVGH